MKAEKGKFHSIPQPTSHMHKHASEPCKMQIAELNEIALLGFHDN